MWTPPISESAEITQCMFPLDQSLLYEVNATLKKVIGFPSPAGMSLTKLSQDGNNLIPVLGEFGKWKENS
jgi:hypothetical protein